MKTTSESAEIRTLLDQVEARSRVFLAILAILLGYGATNFILTEFITGKAERMERVEAINELKLSVQDSMNHITKGDSPDDKRLQNFSEVIEQRIELLRIELSPPKPYRTILPLIFIGFSVFLILIYKTTQQQTQAIRALITEMEKGALNTRKTAKH